MSTWVVPGAPLEQGGGWRIWYSREGPNDFAPSPPRVQRSGALEPSTSTWQLLPALPGLDRRMGVLELRLNAPQPGAAYEVRIAEDPLQRTLRWFSLPDRISSSGVEFLLLSCFWRDADKGALASGLAELSKMRQPAFKLLIGDQVYADWPSQRRPRSGRSSALDMYAERYARYWGDPAYRSVLQQTPNLFTCDDHEFWNDYPEFQPHLMRSWSGFHGDFEWAARALYERYQVCANPGGAHWYRLAIGPVSLFVTDSRSERDCCEEGAHFLQPPQWDDLERWQRSLRGPGVLVLGQPLYQKDGDWRDHSLSNFPDDFGRLMQLVEDSLAGRNDDGRPHDVLVLSGDIHTGRFVVRHPAGFDAPEGVPEFISSPTSMIQPGESEPTQAPGRISSRRAGRASRWDPPRGGDPSATISDNVGLVRMLPGRNGRIRFDLELFEVRARDERSWWARARGATPPAMRLRRIFTQNLELR